MLFDPKFDKRKDDERLHGLQQQIRHAETATPALMSDVLAQACVRLPVLPHTQADCITRLIESEAWTDAAMTLIALELPRWTLRRLLYEDGEWHCCLSSQPNLPVGLDETVEASHDVLALAILSAFVEARQHGIAAPAVSSPTVPRIQSAPGIPICCDNFS
jgi:hypothetical protein